MNTAHHTIAQTLLQARRIVVFTGAGMSAESGIGTFRNAPDSHWSRFDPHELASPEGWRANPRRVWAWYEGRRAEVLAAQPNAVGPGQVHERAMAHLGRAGPAGPGRAPQGMSDQVLASPVKLLEPLRQGHRHSLLTCIANKFA